MRVAIVESLPRGAGPCVKRTVTATIVTPDGRHYVATNWTLRPQAECPRAGMPTGVGYHLCTAICGQSGHAEINALALAGKHARGARMFVEGHSYACMPCQQAARQAGIADIIVGAPT